jgi:hypothetical protein
MKDNEPLVGGRYLVKDGVRTLIEEPTRDHPDGNRARNADGKPVAGPDETHANPAPKPAPAAPAAAQPRKTGIDKGVA